MTQSGKPKSKISIRQYLEEKVVPILEAALMFVAKERPEDPVQCLANYLLENKYKYYQGIDFYQMETSFSSQILTTPSENIIGSHSEPILETIASMSQLIPSTAADQTNSDQKRQSRRLSESLQDIVKYYNESNKSQDK